MLTPEQIEQRRVRLREIGRRGGLTRSKSFSSDYQRFARACVSHEANVANGRKGGIAYVRKYGKRKLVEQARQYRLAHPSDLEQIVESALIAIGAVLSAAEAYEREAYVFPKSRCHLNTGDFVFRKQRKIVFADGAAWHNGKELPASFVNCVDRAMRDEKMDNYLRYRGWRVLRLSEQEIRTHVRGNDQGTLIARLRDFIFTEEPIERRREQVDQANQAVESEAQAASLEGRGGPGEEVSQGQCGAVASGNHAFHCGRNQGTDHAGQAGRDRWKACPDQERKARSRCNHGKGRGT